MRIVLKNIYEFSFVITYCLYFLNVLSKFCCALIIKEKLCTVFTNPFLRKGSSKNNTIAYLYRQVIDTHNYDLF